MIEASRERKRKRERDHKKSKRGEVGVVMEPKALAWSGYQWQTNEQSKAQTREL